jgi:hypothetical protein
MVHADLSEDLAGALRALGLLYGTQAGAPADAVRGAADAREAIRAYILRERPHLLACYELETLVELVRSALEHGVADHPVVEHHGSS